MVGDLDLGAVFGGVVEEIEVGAATQPVVWWLDGRRGEEVVYIGEAIPSISALASFSAHPAWQGMAWHTASPGGSLPDPQAC